MEKRREEKLLTVREDAKIGDTSRREKLQSMTSALAKKLKDC